MAVKRAQQPANATQEPLRKRPKSSREGRLDTMVDNLIKGFNEQQRATTSAFLEWEEKRAAVEAEREKRREERQEERDRQRELREREEACNVGRWSKSTKSD